MLADTAGGELSSVRLLDLVRRGAFRLHAEGVRRGGFVAVDTTSLTWREVAIGYLSVVWLGAAAVLTAGEVSERSARELADVSVLVRGAGRRSAGPAWLCVEELIAAGGHFGAPLAEPDDLLDIVFTSGTTGSPKPVASRHTQWTGLVRPEILASQVRRVVAHTGIPVGVSGGLHGVLLHHLARGVTSRCAPTAAALAASCRDHPADELHLTPHAASGVARVVAPREPWARRVVIIRVVGGPVPEAVAQALAERFTRARVVSVYALTEGGAALCVKVVGGGHRDSVGRPVAGTEVRVLDADGRELPAGEVGELAVRASGTAPLAYFRDESMNRDWFPGGWARSGDLGFVDPGGEVRLVGRVKELIFLRGGRLPPEYVEEILFRRIPEEVEFAVAGVPTAGGWDRIAVFLRGSDSSPEIGEAKRRLADMTGPFRPQIVRVVPEIPRAPFGKPLRRVLTQDLVTSVDQVTRRPTADSP
ncbi:acyl--CoA ligase [Solihabitans fulvus]|uniref:Acyl--CoA ligase n=1 Tax=Solihabitans fulvus TaxID=1892852 RepID=A0A5B2XQW7_9PSEU|nr:class I adenylate-forming enzyme family protein [Solihabitans fulvus]KAA2265806.1 acyl--CoA ligase [Solihabitans fulvus]